MAGERSKLLILRDEFKRIWMEKENSFWPPRDLPLNFIDDLLEQVLFDELKKRKGSPKKFSSLKQFVRNNFSDLRLAFEDALDEGEDLYKEKEVIHFLSARLKFPEEVIRGKFSVIKNRLRKEHDLVSSDELIEYVKEHYYETAVEIAQLIGAEHQDEGQGLLNTSPEAKEFAPPSLIDGIDEASERFANQHINEAMKFYPKRKLH